MIWYRAACPIRFDFTGHSKLPEALDEHRYLAHMRELADQNRPRRSLIGMGYHPCVTPAVIRRNVLENPGWYTPYTPYQAEIAQGRLEALLNFQTTVADLTGLPVANASLLDEGTAAAEAMILAFHDKNKRNAERPVFLVSDRCLPQTIDVLRTRAEPLGIVLRIGAIEELEPAADCFGLLLQYPDEDGRLSDPTGPIGRAREAGLLVAMACDLLALALVRSPAELGADIAFGSAQRFGVPMFYGGPHAAFFATREEFKRKIPGRIIGVSVDANGQSALRMALQTREQHIRREKGDLEYLHRASAACWHGRILRGLAWPGRHPRDRDLCA